MLDIIGSSAVDILGEIAGGRGGEVNDLPRFTLGLIFWGVLLAGALNARRRNALLRDKLLLVGFVVGFSRDLFMLIVTALGLNDLVSANTLALFLPPIDNTLMLVARAVIAAAFLHYFVRPPAISRNFFFLTITVCTLMYFVLAYIWWNAIRANPSLEFANHWGAWFVHLFGATFICVTIILILQQRSFIRIVVAFTFMMYLANHVLMLLNLYSGQQWEQLFLPIGNNLDLWATPLIGFVYWREQRDQHAQLQAEIKQTERLELIGQLSAGVSHDFKNHLQVIRGYAELAQMQRTEPAKVEQCLNEISDTVERSVSLVNQLLAFSSRDKVDKDVSVNINDVVSDLTPMISQLLGQRFQLNFQLDPKVSAVRFDITELEQIIVNLVVNARDAMPNGGKIQFTTRSIENQKSNFGYAANESADGAADEDRTDVVSDDATRAQSGTNPLRAVQLIISDSGSGMSQASIQRAFEPFYTTKAVGEGTGLGLSTVYGLVQRHNGAIKIDSQLYSGTTVTVSLRPAKTPLDAMSRPEGLSALGGTECILVAEDDNSVRNLVCELLSKAGYTVLQAVDGNQALELAKKHQQSIDLLLFDVVMPEMNGYLAYDAITGFMPETPVAFVSADASRVKTNRANYPHLAKPFTRSQLLNYVREQLS